MPSKAHDKMMKARIRLLVGSPFFGTLALGLRLVEREDINTAAVDGVSLYYNPQFIEDLPVDQVKGVIAHEVMHVACMHCLRRGARDHRKWNIACDYSINGLLLKAGLLLPPSRLFDEQYDGMSSEAIYNRLSSDAVAGGAGDEADPGRCGGVMDDPNAGDGSTQEAAETMVKAAVARATAAAKAAGKFPAVLDGFVDEILNPAVPWRDVLRRFMTDRMPTDFSWRNGSRRFLADGLYLPTLDSVDAMDSIVVAVDTSGSVSKEEMEQFGQEIRGIIADCCPKDTHVIYCDAAVQHVDYFERNDVRIEVRRHGRGGTDFAPPFDWVEKHGVAPKCLVYLTDGMGPFPKEPSYPVLWCLTTDSAKPPFGETTHVAVAAN